MGNVLAAHYFLFTHCTNILFFQNYDILYRDQRDAIHPVQSLKFITSSIPYRAAKSYHKISYHTISYYDVISPLYQSTSSRQQEQRRTTENLALLRRIFGRSQYITRESETCHHLSNYYHSKPIAIDDLDVWSASAGCQALPGCHKNLKA